MSGDSQASCPTPVTPAVPGHPPETRPHPGVAPLASVRALQSDWPCGWQLAPLSAPWPYRVRGSMGLASRGRWPARGGPWQSRACRPAQHGPEPSTFCLLSVLGFLCPLLSPPPGRVSHGPSGVPETQPACPCGRWARVTPLLGHPGLGFPSGLLAVAHIPCLPPAFVSPALPSHRGPLAVPPGLQPQPCLRAFARAAPVPAARAPDRHAAPSLPTPLATEQNLARRRHSTALG